MLSSPLSQGVIQGNGSLVASTPGFVQVILNNGTIAPGLSTGQIFIDGDLVLNSGNLLLEADSLVDLDQLLITGDLILNGGSIDVLLGFAPGPGW